MPDEITVTVDLRNVPYMTELVLQDYVYGLLAKSGVPIENESLAPGTIIVRDDPCNPYAKICTWRPTAPPATPA